MAARCKSPHISRTDHNSTKEQQNYNLYDYQFFDGSGRDPYSNYYSDINRLYRYNPIMNLRMVAVKLPSLANDRALAKLICSYRLTEFVSHDDR
jgi:hypothetical protein